MQGPVSVIVCTTTAYHTPIIALDPHVDPEDVLSIYVY